MMEKIQPWVRELMNEKLLAPFSPEDVKKAIFLLGTSKLQALMGFMRVL
jgi:hypothetical protein